jgi:transcriptional regulator with XRE-family HTH domain
MVRARIRRGLSQTDAAAEAGVARSAWAAWELGTEPRGLYRRALEAWLREGREAFLPWRSGEGQKGR